MLLSSTLRGQHPHFAGLTGIFGNCTISGNQITGSDPNPASHSQPMVGIEVWHRDGSAQQHNRLERLNVGVLAELGGPFAGPGPHSNAPATYDISGNLLRDCYQGLRFGQYYSAPLIPGTTLRLRCNTFQNPARLPGSVGIYVDAVSIYFPTDLGSNSDPNGNKFGVNGVLEPSFTPIVNDNGQSFIYHAYSASNQELFPMNTTSYGYSVSKWGGNPAYACLPYNNGINARHG